MSIFTPDQSQEIRERSLSSVAKIKPTGFAENAAATWKAFKNSEAAGALRGSRMKAWDERLKKVREITGQEIESPWSNTPDMARSFKDRVDPNELGTTGRILHSLPDLDPVDFVFRQFDNRNGLTEPQRLKAHEERLNKIRETLPEDQRHLIPTRDEIEAALKEKAGKLEGKAADVSSRATMGGLIGGFIGGSGAAVTQPEVLMTLPLGAPARVGLLAKVLIEAGIGGATETLLQPMAQGQRQELGLDSGFGHAAQNVLMASAGAGGLTAAVGGAVKLVMKGGVPVFEKLMKRKARADEEALIHSVQHDSAMENAAPYENRTAAAKRVQAENEAAGFDAAVEGRPLSEQEIKEDLGNVRAAMEGDPSTLRMLTNDEISKIEVDAELMQFKSGGNAEGVTDRLIGVKQWELERAGVSLVFEYADGRQIIADGHQRLALAKRLAGEGQKIQMPTIVLREIDGISPVQARGRAAIKNIAELTGSSTDAAKVFRDLGLTPDELNLPPKSAMIRDAEGLSQLDEVTFGMVINEVITEGQGAAIGRLVRDPRLQPQIAKLLARLQPANKMEEESIIRQALQAGVSRETQTSLFGEEEIVQSLFLERARVLNRSLNMIKRDVSTFKALDERSGDITAAGNVLDEAGNAERLQMEKQLQEYIRSQAHRKGAISDELEKAARQAKETGQYKAAARGFVESLARRIERGEIDGGDVRSGRADPELERASPETSAQQQGAPEQIAPDPKELEGFSEPVSKASDDQALEIQREIMDLAIGREKQLDVEMPMGERIDADGNRVSETSTVRKVMDDLEEDQEFYTQLQLCDGGGG